MKTEETEKTEITTFGFVPIEHFMKSINEMVLNDFVLLCKSNFDFYFIDRPRFIR